MKCKAKKERVHDLIHLYLIWRNKYSDTVSLYLQSLDKYLFFRNTEYTVRPNLCHVIFMWFMKFKSMRWFFVSIFFPFGKTLAVMMDRDDDNENCYESYNMSLCSSIKIKAPQDVDVLAVLDHWSPCSLPQSRRGCPSFHPWPSWRMGKLLGYKTGVSGRIQGIWKSRTAKTSTSCVGLFKGQIIPSSSIVILEY